MKRKITYDYIHKYVAEKGLPCTLPINGVKWYVLFYDIPRDPYYSLSYCDDVTLKSYYVDFHKDGSVVIQTISFFKQDSFDLAEYTNNL